MGIRFPKDDKSLLAILVIIYLLSRIPFLTYLPFIQDENLHAIIINEAAAHLSLLPTFFGYPVSWKPFLFFWAYAPFSGLISTLPLEAAYRLPSFIFGLAAIIPLYFFVRKMGSSSTMSFFTLTAYLLTNSAMYSNDAVIVESMLVFFIFSSLYIYSEERFGKYRFLAAGLLALVAVFVKFVIALLIPLLAIAYFFFKDKKTLQNKIFLASLLAVPLGLAIHYSILNTAGLAKEAYLLDIGYKLTGGSSSGGKLSMIMGALSTAYTSFGIWFFLSLFAFIKNYKKYPFMAFWYIISIIPLTSGSGLSWYFLPVLPPIAFFALIMVIEWEGKEKPDAIFFCFFSLVCAFMLITVWMNYNSINNSYLPQKQTGLELAGKQNVLIIGNYAPAVMAYKVLTELKNNGTYNDFGWAIDGINFNSSNIRSITYNYSNPDFPVMRGSMSSMFTSDSIYLKDSNITRFDYVAITRANNFSASDLLGSSAKLIYNNSGYLIYKLH